MKTTEELNDAMSEDLKTHLTYAVHDRRIEAHYKHAREKHPYFCDIITCLSAVGADTHLDIYRSTLAAEVKSDALEAGVVLFSEFYEAMQAYTKGNTAHAVEECYDAIAVLLRTIDVLEGRQELGKPEGANPKEGRRIRSEQCTGAGTDERHKTDS